MAFVAAIVATVAIADMRTYGPNWGDVAILGASFATLAGSCAYAVWPAVRWMVRARSPKRPSGPVATSREPIPAGLRFAVLRRDGFRCAYCGRGEPERVRLHIDHLRPVALGGKNELDNLVTACQDCNLGKSASDLVG